jgi:hypothetical protein
MTVGASGGPLVLGDTVVGVRHNLQGQSDNGVNSTFAYLETDARPAYDQAKALSGR